MLTSEVSIWWLSQYCLKYARPKYFLSVLVCCILCTVSLAQTSKIDSLSTIVTDPALSDSEKLYVHYQLSKSLLRIDPQLSEFHINAGLDLIDGQRAKHKEVNYIDFLINQCQLTHNNRDYKKSKAINDRIEKNIKDAIDKPMAQVWVLEKKAAFDAHDHNYTKAKAYLIEGLKIAEQCDRRELQSLMHNRLGIYYEKHTNRIDSVLYHVTADAKLTDDDNYTYKLIDNLNLAEVHFHIGNDSIAKEILTQGLLLYGDVRDKGLLSAVSYNLAKVYRSEGDLDQAEYYLNNAFEVLSGFENVEDVYYQCIHEKGILDCMQGDPYKAIESFEEALIYFEEVESDEWIGRSLIRLTDAWLEQDKRLSRGYYERALENNAYDITGYRDKREYLRLLAKIASELNDFQEAYQLETTIVNMVQERNDIEEELYLIEYKDRYETEIGSRAREYEIQSLITQKIRLPKLYGVGGTAIFILIGLFAVALNARKQKIFELAVSIRSEQLKELNEELEHKREELERFAFITAHDLKAPLLSIIGFSNLLNKELASLPYPRIKEYIGFINSSSQQMKNLIQSVLEFAKLNRSLTDEQTEHIDLTELVQEIKHDLNLSHSIDSPAIISIEGNYLKVSANRVMVSTVFKKLIENGICYNQSEQPTMKIVSNMDNDQVKITFADNGIGIDERYHSTIFEMFSRLHNNHDYTGSGIGLAVVKKLIDDFDGEIKVSSTKGEGSTFEVLLPISSLDNQSLR